MQRTVAAIEEKIVAAIEDRTVATKHTMEAMEKGTQSERTVAASYG